MNEVDTAWLAENAETVLHEQEPERALVPFVPPVPGSDAGDAGDEPSDELPGRKRSLVEIAEDEAELFHDDSGAPYARLVVAGHREVWPLGSKHFKEWLVGLYYAERQTVPKTAALSEALLAINGHARFRGPQHEVNLRIARHGNGLLVDLANDEWQAVEVTAEGWRVVTDPPVVFRRTRSMASLPVPVRGGSVAELRRFLNVAEEDGWRLLVSWLLFAFSPAGPYPVLILHGEQGSAKSTAARLLRSLVDPAVGSGLRAAPKDQEDLAVACHNGRVVALDNLSSLRPWLSDALCRIATGGGLSKRELYSDAEEIVLDAQRPIVMNGITELATRGDLLDRSLLVDLEPIGEDRRLTEKDLWRDFDEARPAIFGALLDALVATFARLPDVQLSRHPRMADFALFATAAERGLGWEDGAFLAAYEGNREAANDLALDASPVGPALRSLVEASGKWKGTAEDLRSELAHWVSEAVAKSEFWPKNAWAMSNRLDRLAPNLRATGVGVHKHRKAHGNRERLITLWLIADHGDQPPTDAGDAGDAAAQGSETSP